MPWGRAHDILAGFRYQNTPDFLDALKLADTGVPCNPGPWLLAKGVPRFCFDSWLEDEAFSWLKAAFEEDTGSRGSIGSIFYFGENTAPHARTAGWFTKQLAVQLQQQQQFLDFTHKESFSIPNYGSKMPDFAIVPRTKWGTSLPCMVLEVGYHVEKNFREVQKQVTTWCQYGSPVVIGVKITDNDPPATHQNPRIEVCIRLQGHVGKIYHLGQGSSAPCTRAGTHVITIPAKLFLARGDRSSVPPQTPPVLLDLFALQKDVRRWVLDHASGQA